MKTCLAILTIFALGGVASAQDTPTPGGGKPDRKGLRQRILEKFDANHDGKLDETERAAAKAAMKQKHEEKRAEIFKKLDTDGNGQLSAAELQAGREARQAKRKEHRAELLKKYDANGDGKLDRDERKAMRAAGDGHRKHKGKHGKRGDKKPGHDKK